VKKALAFSDTNSHRALSSRPELLATSVLKKSRSLDYVDPRRRVNDLNPADSISLPVRLHCPLVSTAFVRRAETNMARNGMQCKNHHRFSFFLP